MRRTLLAALVLAVVLTAGLWIGRATAGDKPEAGMTPTAVDIGFLQDMSAHHQQAVLMAQEALDRGADPAVRLVARQILLTQAQERGTMAGWLTAWNAPQLPSGPPMTWMSHPVPGMVGQMPGMATQPDLDSLATSDGKQFDTRFLQLMTRHHTGGILMAREAQARAALPLVTALAGTMIIEESQETTVMLQLLSADGAPPLPLN